MIDNYYYDEEEKRLIMKSMNVIIDTREKENSHITSYLEKNGVPYIKRMLDFGDYSFFVPKNPDLQIFRDISFEKKIAIERKNSLEELSLCFTKTRTRLEDEFMRGAGAKKYLLVENCSYMDIVLGNYKSKYNSKAYLGSIHSFEHKYDLNIMYMQNKSFSPVYIYWVFQYYLREFLKLGD